LQGDVRAGLQRASLLPRGRLSADAQAGWSSLAGGYVRGEVGFRPMPMAKVFGFGQWRPSETTVGIGIGVDF
jgi:hypothetical protein